MASTPAHSTHRLATSSQGGGIAGPTTQATRSSVTGSLPVALLRYLPPRITPAPSASGAHSNRPRAEKLCHLPMRRIYVLLDITSIGRARSVTSAAAVLYLQSEGRAPSLQRKLWPVSDPVRLSSLSPWTAVSVIHTFHFSSSDRLNGTPSSILAFSSADNALFSVVRLTMRPVFRSITTVSRTRSGKFALERPSLPLLADSEYISRQERLQVPRMPRRSRPPASRD